MDTTDAVSYDQEPKGGLGESHSLERPHKGCGALCAASIKQGLKLLSRQAFELVDT
jgi:hypothetical protein